MTSVSRDISRKKNSNLRSIYPLRIDINVDDIKAIHWDPKVDSNECTAPNLAN